MSQKDPFLQREAEKYDNPIASREMLLELIRGHEKPMSREELAKVLKLTDEEPLEALRRRLRAMERDGQLVFTRNQCYALPDRLNLVKGYVLGHKDGFGFLRPEGGGPDLYLNNREMQRLMHGDYALVQPTEIFAQHEDTAGGGPVLTQDQAEESGLARAGGAHEEDELTPIDLEVDVAKRGLGLTRVDLRHVLECDHVTVLFLVPI